jgi:hypothetical protein
VKIIHGTPGHPWVPGAAFAFDDRLEPLLRVLEESGIETAEDLSEALATHLAKSPPERNHHV